MLRRLGGYLFKVLDRARPTACWYLLMTATPKIHKGADHTSFNWPAALLFSGPFSNNCCPAAGLLGGPLPPTIIR